MNLRSTLTQWLTSGSDRWTEVALREINESFESFSTEERVEQALELLPGAQCAHLDFGAKQRSCSI